MSDATPALNPLLDAPGDSVLAMRTADVGTTRERRRTQRWLKLTAALLGLVALLWARALTWDPTTSFVPYPHIDPFLLTIIVFFGLMVVLGAAQTMNTGRSNHVVYRADQISTRMADVVGIDGVR